MNDFFEEAFEYTLKNEGGFSNDAQDHGGATRYGITRADASKFYGRSVSVAEMREFPLEDAKKIYRSWYYDANHCGQMAAKECAIPIFDIGVVCGIMTSAKMAQQVCNQLGCTLVVDGHIGLKSQDALNLTVHPAEFLRAFAARTEQRFRGIVANNPSQGVFLRGWVNRAHRLLTIGTH